jgi:hypothetical protein
VHFAAAALPERKERAMPILSRDRLISLRRPQTLSGFCAASVAALTAFGVASVAALAVTLPPNRSDSAPISAADASSPRVVAVSAPADEATPLVPQTVVAKPKLDETGTASADESDAATAQSASRPAHPRAAHHHARTAAPVVPVRAELGGRAARPGRHPAHTASHLVPASRMAPPS